MSSKRKGSYLAALSGIGVLAVVFLVNLPQRIPTPAEPVLLVSKTATYSCGASCGTRWKNPNRPSVLPPGRPYLAKPFRPVDGVWPEISCPPGCYCHTDTFYNEYYAVDYALAVERKTGDGGTEIVRRFSVVAADGGTLTRHDLGDSITAYIDHDNGWKTVYTHLEEVRVDDRVIGNDESVEVDRGDEIGTSSNTGIPNADDSDIHLHFELRHGSGFTSCNSYSYPIDSVQLFEHQGYAGR